MKDYSALLLGFLALHVAAVPVPRLPGFLAIGGQALQDLNNAEAQSDQAFQTAQQNAQQAGDSQAQKDLNDARARANQAFQQAQANAQRAG